MSRSVSFTSGATSSTAAFKVPGWMLLPCPAISTCTSEGVVGSHTDAQSWRMENGTTGLQVLLSRHDASCLQALLMLCVLMPGNSL